MSIRTNAKSIGTKDAQSEVLAAEIRKAWLKASAERKAELAREFKIGYIAGKERISLSDAEAIFDAGKGAGVPKKHVAMIDRSVSGFNYHIAKAKASTGAAPQASMRIQAHIREAAMTFLGEFEGENLAEQIAKALKVLNAMK